MIRYALRCASEHSFESWFKSAGAFDTLLSTGLIACPHCGSAEVQKAIMAPQVRPSRSVAGPPRAAGPGKPAPSPLSAPENDAQRALGELRRKVEASSDYVGKEFASEARRMHLGESPERSIYGEARLEDARKLIDDGIPVAPLPFMSARKTN